MKINDKNFAPLLTRPAIQGYLLISILMLVLYVYLYLFSPLGTTLTDVILNSTISLGALIAACFSTSIYFHYHPEDQPRKVWLNIMAGSWMWFLGEFIWQVYAYYGDVPIPSAADYFWVIGFLFFTIALYHQYILVTPAKKDTVRTVAIGIWLVVLLIPVIYLSLTNSFKIDFYVEFYYPFADLAVGISGLMLVFIFRGGALMRPWVGLMVFGLSDLLYAWAEKTHLYAISAQSGNILSLVIDITYLAAYLVLGFGYMGQWILLRYSVETKN